MTPNWSRPGRPTAWLRRVGIGLSVTLVLFLTPPISPAIAATNHWSFQPVRRPAVPTIRSHASQAALHPVDAFLLARRDGRPLAPRANRATLLRRATFDLIGLPPTPDELDAFERDQSPNAFARVVDRLLASPHYGERWGRHWMDVVRYADTAGDNADYPVPEARLYRDYIIDAFNRDKPYDQFVREQLAGDLLAAGATPEVYAERVTATGFLALSRRYATAPFEFMHLTIEDAIETTGRAFLGMTFRCARCHDHKYDPVTREDYYALYGLFESTRFPYAGSEEFQSKKFPRNGFQPLLPPDQSAPLLQAHQGRLDAIEGSIKGCEQALATTNRAVAPVIGDARKALEEKLKALQAEQAALKRPGASMALPVAYAVTDGPAIDSRVQLRGEPNETGAPVPRRAPRFLAGDESLHIPAGASGRRQFAEWLARPGNPLTARVMVNRIWQHHFGRGLVATPSNFGLRGDPPTHPELLDYLAGRFVESGWSIKAMHRLIMSSAAYRQEAGGGDESSNRLSGAAARPLTPASRLLTPDPFTPFPRRRLSAEEIRDTMLFVAGSLELERPGAHPFPPIAEWSWTQHNPFKAVYESNHRSVYLMTQRLQRHPYLALFDGPDANVSTDVRTESTVPLQALYVMNNPWVEAQAVAFARRLMSAASRDDERIRLACRLAWSREPGPNEVRRALRFLGEFRDESLRTDDGKTADQVESAAWTSYARVLLTSNEFFYVE